MNRPRKPLLQDVARLLFATLFLCGCTSAGASPSDAPTPTSTRALPSPTSAPTITPPAPTATPPPAVHPTFTPYIPVAPERPALGEAYVSPDGARQAFIKKQEILIVRDSDGQERDLLTTDEIASLAWFPDGKHILYSFHDLSQEIMARRDPLWVVNVESGERHQIGAGFYPSISPDGRYVALRSGVLWGDACLVGYELAVLELDATLNVVATYRQEDFGLPTEEDAASFHPTGGMRWQSDAELIAGLRWGCAGPEDQESGLYALNLATLEATKIAELPSD